MKKNLVCRLRACCTRCRQHELASRTLAQTCRTSPSSRSAKRQGEARLLYRACGANIQGDLGKTARDYRCFEIRFYTVDPSRWCGSVKGGITELPKRLRDGELKFFKRRCGTWMAVWQKRTIQHVVLFSVLQGPRRREEVGPRLCRSQVDRLSEVLVPLTPKSHS